MENPSHVQKQTVRKISTQSGIRLIGLWRTRPSTVGPRRPSGRQVAQGVLPLQAILIKLLTYCQSYVAKQQSKLTNWHPIMGWFKQPSDKRCGQSSHCSASCRLVTFSVALKGTGCSAKYVSSPIHNYCLTCPKPESNETQIPSPFRLPFHFLTFSLHRPFNHSLT